MPKAVVIKPSGEFEAKEMHGPLYKSMGAVVQGYIELVRIENPVLQLVRDNKRVVMVVNEEGLLKKLELNPVATFLYSMGLEPIVGNVVLCKEEMTPEGPDLVLFSDDEVQRCMEDLACFRVVKVSLKD